jgi:hypothetical protein
MLLLRPQLLGIWLTVCYVACHLSAFTVYFWLLRCREDKIKKKLYVLPPNLSFCLISLVLACVGSVQG